MYILLNWNKGNPYNNMLSIMMLLFMILISVSVSAMNPIVDNYGHIGGLIYGFFLLPIVSKPEDKKDSVCCEFRIWRIISIIFCLVFYLGGFLVFFFVRNPPAVKY